MATTPDESKRKPIQLDDWKKGLRKADKKLDPQWSLDPANRYVLKEIYMAGEDLMKTRMSVYGRALSPTKHNPIQLRSAEYDAILGIGDHAAMLEKAVKNMMKTHLKRSSIGRWIMEQKGLGAGWLGGVVLGSLPDIYDAAICNDCGRYLIRTKDMEQYHPVPPAKRDGADSKSKCVHDGTLVAEENYHIHERKPSTFVRFAGLATVEGFACPDCNYLLKKNSITKTYTHPAYANLPDGVDKCAHNGTSWKPNAVGVPVLKKKKAKEVRMSDTGAKGKAHTYNSKLRAKLIGPGGVVESFIRSGHPVYYKLYTDHKQKKTSQQPWKSKGWIDMMGKRKVASQFLIDLFIKWRELEGIPCRPSYAEEKLGIKHHA